MATKNQVTRADCKERLMDSAKADLKFHLLLTVLASAFFLPFGIFGIYLMATQTGLWLGGLHLSVISTAFLSGLGYQIGKDVMRCRAIRMDRFSIERDTVHHTAKQENVWGYRNPQKCIYFSKYGRYVSGGKNFTFAVRGEEFYLVVLHLKKPKIMGIYHPSGYECNELGPILQNQKK